MSHECLRSIISLCANEGKKSCHLTDQHILSKDLIQVDRMKICNESVEYPLGGTLILHFNLMH